MVVYDLIVSSHIFRLLLTGKSGKNEKYILQSRSILTKVYFSLIHFLYNNLYSLVSSTHYHLLQRTERRIQKKQGILNKIYDSQTDLYWHFNKIYVKSINF